MNDLISRQAAIDAFCSHCYVSRPETCSTIQEGDKWCEEVYTILNLPSAQPEPSQVARDIATLIENEQDMRVILKNAQAESSADDTICHCNVKENAELIAKILDDDVCGKVYHAERKKGEWKPFDLTYGRSIYACSCCGNGTEVPTDMGEPLYNYCPNCGADMREDGEADESD